MANKTIIGEVRFSYLHVFEPWSADETTPKNFTATLLIPKTNTKLVEEIRKAIREAYDVAVTEKWGGKKPPFDKVSPLRDGDEPKDDGESRGEAYEGHYFLNAKSRTQPGVIGSDRKPILDSEEFYSGCYGYASVGFSGFSHTSGKMGISIFLNNLMKTRDGEPLGGTRTTAESDFAGVQLGEDDL